MPFFKRWFLNDDAKNCYLNNHIIYLWMISLSEIHARNSDGDSLIQNWKIRFNL